MVGLLSFIPFYCCCDHKLQQTFVRGMQAGRAPQKSRLAEKGRRPSLRGGFHIVLHHGPCNARASKAQLQRQQNTARIYEHECSCMLPSQRAWSARSCSRTLMRRKASSCGIREVHLSSILPLTPTVQQVQIQGLGVSLDRKDL